MSLKYKKISDIDFAKVESYEYSTSDYFKDVSFYKVASHYLKLNHLRDEIFDYELHLKNDPEGKTHYLRINDKLNNCLFDFEPINVEQMVMILETKSLENTDSIEVNKIINDITGIDLKDYISHVYYEGGGEDYIEIERKQK